jgi:hypothetical protein
MRAGRKAAWRHTSLPWVHRVFANLKRWLTGTFHGAHKQRWCWAIVFYDTGARGAAKHGVKPPAWHFADNTPALPIFIFNRRNYALDKVEVGC